MRKGKTMKRRRNSIVTTLLVLSFGLMGMGTANAQVFIMEDDDFHNIREDADGNLALGDFTGIFLPEHDDTHDFTPLGDGILLLGCLGGAYLLGKKRRSKTDLSD